MPQAAHQVGHVFLGPKSQETPGEIPLSQDWPSPGAPSKETPQKGPGPESLEMGRRTHCPHDSSLPFYSHTKSSHPSSHPPSPRAYQRPLPKTSHPQGPAVIQSLQNRRARILGNSKQSRKGQTIHTPGLPAPLKGGKFFSECPALCWLLPPCDLT